MQAEAVFNIYHQNINRILVDDQFFDSTSFHLLLKSFKYLD